MNGLSYQIDVDTTISEAEVLCRSLQALIEQKDEEQITNNTQASVALPSIDEELKTLVARRQSVS